jgi:hypothetical protein
VVAVAILLGVGNLAVTLLRSTIPIAVEGTITRIDIRPEAHPGVDDVNLLSVDGRTIVVDTAVIRDLRVGDEIRKDAWSTTLETPRGPKHLDPSDDLWGMVVVMPLIASLCAAMMWRPRRRLRAGATTETA